MTSALALRTPVFSGAFNSISDEIDSLFGGSTRFKSSVPVDIEETEEGYNLSFELPGIDRKDINVEVKDGIVTVSGERKHEYNSDKGRYAYYERSIGSFSRSFRMPENVSESNVSAKLKDGILSLQLVKTPESKPKRISIE